MPYLQLDLDAKKRMPLVAKASGISNGDVMWGLSDLWELAWGTKREVISDVELSGCFGPGELVRAALEAHRFVERVPEGWRVKGADRYLRISDARSEAGKTRSATAQRDEKGRLIKSSLSSTRPALAGEPASNGPALTPNTEHQSPRDSKTTPLSTSSTFELALQEPPVAKAPDDAQQVFEHWRGAMGKGAGAKFSSERRKKVEARLKDGFTVEQLCKAIDGCAGSSWHMGQNDRGKRFDDLELICRDVRRVEDFIATAAFPPNPANPTNRKPSIEDTPCLLLGA